MRITCQDSKNCIDTIVSLFGIEIDINLFIAQIFADKLQRARVATGKAFCK